MREKNKESFLFKIFCKLNSFHDHNNVDFLSWKPCIIQNHCLKRNGNWSSQRKMKGRRRTLEHLKGWNVSIKRGDRELLQTANVCTSVCPYCGGGGVVILVTSPTKVFSYQIRCTRNQTTRIKRNMNRRLRSLDSFCAVILRRLLSHLFFSHFVI